MRRVPLLAVSNLPPFQGGARRGSGVPRRFAPHPILSPEGRAVLKCVLVFAAGLLAQSIVSVSQAAQQQDTKSETTKATYSVTGLHCPPCTKTVEASLKKVKGVRAAKVDWNTKTAQIEFDESVLPAQKLAQAIATTPHMMGSSMHYGSWLSLKVPDLKDEAAAAKVKETLGKQTGVKRVATYPAQHVVNVEFAGEGSATTHQLIDPVAETGLHAETR